MIRVHRYEGVECGVDTLVDDSRRTAATHISVLQVSIGSRGEQIPNCHDVHKGAVEERQPCRAWKIA
jgi:hypothetical protein